MSSPSPSPSSPSPSSLEPLLRLFPLPYRLLLPTIDSFSSRTGIDVLPIGERGKEVRGRVEGWVGELIRAEEEEAVVVLEGGGEPGRDGAGEGQGGMDRNVFLQMLSLLGSTVTDDPPHEPCDDAGNITQLDRDERSLPARKETPRVSNSGRIRSPSDVSSSSGSAVASSIGQRSARGTDSAHFRREGGHVGAEEDEVGSASHVSASEGIRPDRSGQRRGSTMSSGGGGQAREADEMLDLADGEEGDDSGFASHPGGNSSRDRHAFPSDPSRVRTGSVGEQGDQSGRPTVSQRRRRVRSNRSDESLTGPHGNTPSPLPPTAKGPFTNRVGLSFPLSSPTRASPGRDHDHGHGRQPQQTPPSAFSMGGSVGIGRKYVTSDPARSAASAFGGGGLAGESSGIARTTSGGRNRGESNAGVRSRVSSTASEWDGERGHGVMGWDGSTPVRRTGRGPPPSSFGMALGGTAEGGFDGHGRQHSVGSDRVVISPSAETSSFFGDRSSSNPILTRPKPPHRSTRRRSSGPIAQPMTSPTSPTTSINPYLDDIGMISPSPSAPALFDTSRPKPQRQMSIGGVRSPTIDDTSFVRHQGWSSPDGREQRAGAGMDDGDGWGRERREERYSRMTASSDESSRLEHDELQRENHELKRKKESLEKALVDTKAELDNELARLQGEIDETHVQLKEKKAEEGENAKRMAERSEHIKSLEATITGLQDRLKGAAKTRDNDQKNLNALIAEKSVLRAENDDHKHKVGELEESEQNLLMEKSVVGIQLDSLTRMNEELLEYKSEAERIARDLDDQKQVNHQLREEISRLEGTLRDARTRHTRDGTSTSGVGAVDSESGTVSRNLGAEMLRSSFDLEEAGSATIISSSTAEVGRPSTRPRERTILRTTIHYRSNAATNGQALSPTGSEEAIPASATEDVDGDITEGQILDVEYADAATSTSAGPDLSDAAAQTDDSLLGSLPPYTRHQDAQDAHAASHPHLLGGTRGDDLSQEDHEALQRAYGEVSSSLALRCTVMEEGLGKIQKEHMARAGTRDSSSAMSLGNGQPRARTGKKIANSAGSSEFSMLAPIILVPSCLILAGAIGYMVGLGHGSITLAGLEEMLLLRDIAAFTSAAAGFGYAGSSYGNNNYFIAGTQALKVIGGGARMPTGRVPV